MRRLRDIHLIVNSEDITDRVIKFSIDGESIKIKRAFTEEHDLCIVTETIERSLCSVKSVKIEIEY